MTLGDTPLTADDPLPHRPRRVLVTGCSGSGKTTLAAALAVRLGIPHQELDALFHGSGWVPRPTFVAEVTALAATESWVVEWQYEQVRSLLLTRADLLVWLDLSGTRVFAQLLSRTVCWLSSRSTIPRSSCGCGAVGRSSAGWRTWCDRNDPDVSGFDHRRRRSRRAACPAASARAAPVACRSNDCSRRERRVRVLGVDPGLTRCGLGVVDGSGGRQVRCVAVDVVRSPSDAPVEQRLLAVGAVVEEWITRHRPDVVAIERVFSQQNVRTVMGTAQASGVVALLAARAGLPVAFHTPSEVKAAVTGEGRAGKAQVTAMVTRLLALADTPRPADAADALALAICHCWRAPMLERMAQAKTRSDALARAHRARLAAAAKASPTRKGAIG